MTAADIAAAVGAYTYRYRDEADLQDGLAAALDRAGVRYERERAVASGCRVDFLCGRVAVEVKVNGSPSEVARQLRRYLAAPDVDEVVLVTSRASHCSLAATDVVVALVGDPF